MSVCSKIARNVPRVFVRLLVHTYRYILAGIRLERYSIVCLHTYGYILTGIARGLETVWFGSQLNALCFCFHVCGLQSSMTCGGLRQSLHDCRDKFAAVDRKKLGKVFSLSDHWLASSDTIQVRRCQWAIHDCRGRGMSGSPLSSQA